MKNFEKNHKNTERIYQRTNYSDNYKLSKHHANIEYNLYQHGK